MPSSKRAKVVHLSKNPSSAALKKTCKVQARKLYDNIREAVPGYAYVYVFAVDNMRNTHLKEVRSELADSRLFFGKTKVMAKALGNSPATEAQSGTSLLTPHLTGEVGLIFSPRKPAAVLAHFDAFRPLDYARAGTVAPRSFILPAGTLHSRGGQIDQDQDVPLAHSVEPTLRKLGVPTRLVKGKVELEQDFVVCSKGDVLGSGQTTLLKTFGVTMAEFRVAIRAYWQSETGEVTVVGGGDDGTMDLEESEASADRR